MGFVYPKFSKYSLGPIRIGGAGLGNLLFIYARALVYAKQHRLTLIAPTWATLKLGPFLRNEKDKRLYLNIFRPAGIKGLKKMGLLLSLKKYREDSFLPGQEQSGNSLLVVEGLRNYFEDFKHESTYIREALLRICKANTLKQYSTYKPKTIAVHIRLGDYSAENRMAMAWYIEKIKQVRLLGYNYNAVIFSDGKDAELEAILALPNTSREKSANALIDLLKMSKAEILIGSNSTFSAWAAFLGRNHFIRPENFYPGNIYTASDNAYEGALEGIDQHHLIRKTAR